MTEDEEINAHEKEQIANCKTINKATKEIGTDRQVTHKLCVSHLNSNIKQRLKSLQSLIWTAQQESEDVIETKQYSKSSNSGKHKLIVFIQKQGKYVMV